MNRFVVGVDVGGTSVKLGLVDCSGRVITRARLDTKQFGKRPLALIRGVANSIQSMIKEQKLGKRQIQGVGVGLPGPIDYPRGVVRYLPNVPGWSNVKFQHILEELIHFPVRIDNDVNMITLGEWGFGAAKNLTDVLCITLGTGVGGGLIFNNQLYRGASFAAGEIGQMPFIGEPIKNGQFLAYEKKVGHRQLADAATSMYQSKKRLTIEEMYTKAKKGEPKALRFWEQAATHIAYGLVGPITLLNPKAVIIGGGVANNYVFIHKTMKKVIQQHVMSTQAKTVVLKKAKLGDDAGIIGAQVLLNQGDLCC